MSIPINFNNLKYLLNDMRNKNRIIEAFPFNYNQRQYAVILTRYKPDEPRPDDYAQAKLEFFNLNSENSIFAYADFYEVHFKSATDFINFFKINVQAGAAKIREIFQSFSNFFADFIPTQTKKDLDIIYKRIVATRLEPNSPNTIYCYDVRRNGKDKAGKPNRRSVENSEKAKILRPELYEKFKADSNYSFFFSDNPSDEKTDAEIIREVTNRQ
ncbi:TPA: DUF6037 family protein [Neisseria meningitidis]